MIRLPSILYAAVLTVGCTADETKTSAEQMASDRPQIHATVHPSHLTSRVRETGIFVELRSNRPIDTALLGDLASTLRVRRGTSFIQVTAAARAATMATPTATEKPKGSELEEVDDPASVIDVLPIAGFASDWHVLESVDVLSSRGIIVSGRDLDSSGRLRVRFHPDSTPILASLKVCSDDGRDLVIFVNFSELVEVPTSDRVDQFFSVTSDGLECEYTPHPLASHAPWLQFNCPSSGAIHFRAFNGLKSETGLPVRYPDETTSWSRFLRIDQMPTDLGETSCSRETYWD